MFRLFLLFGAIFAVALGVLVEDPEPQIIDGTIAQLRQFQYAASIRRAGVLGHLGGGVLISDRWVLTAGTVMIQFARPQDAAVALGILNFATTVVSPGLVSTVSAIRFHPGFSNTGAVPIDNIALVQIPIIACIAARFGIIAPIFLEPRIQSGDFSGVVAGWGPISINKDPNTLLRFAVTSTPDTSPDNSFNTCPGATASTLCMRNVLCTTDVGSGLVTPFGLIGIASTTACDGTSDLYSRISHYHAWITSNAGI